jgi:hypothetical protein
VTAVTPESRTFDPAGLLRVLDGRYADVRQEIRTALRHHERYLRPTASLQVAGCFAMTEAGHGSDVQQLRTTATYDPASGEFVVDTPDDEARKEYIGNAACHGRLAAVFAQLVVAGEQHGVHCLVVELRDERGAVREGVRIEDCGEKMGLNGVDNGRIWFDHMRVPREALLNRYGDVDADGVYSSPIESAGRQAVETVIERLLARQIVQLIGDFVSRGDDDDDLLAPDDQLSLFEWREGHITASAAQRFKRGLDEGHEPFEVFRAVQDHAVNAARAHMATVLLAAFQRAVAACEDEDLRSVLKLLCDLYALQDLESDRAFFMEHGRLAGARCKAITREVNRLCNEARLCAAQLVDALGIPDEVLAAPIGLRDAPEAA